MKRGLRARTIGASILLAAIVAVVFGLLLQATEGERDAAAEARRTGEILTQAARVERSLVDLEAGARGYAITGDEAFLEPWTAARRALPGTLGTLESLVEDVEQVRRLEALERVLESYLAEWSNPLVETARTDAAAALDLIETGEGRERATAVRAEIERFTTGQRASAAAARVHADSTADRVRWIAVGGLAGTVALVLLVAVYLGRAVVAPVRGLSAAASRLGEGDFAVRVPETGAGEVAQLARSFNGMATTIEENREELAQHAIELESQNAELELQAAELEDQQTQVVRANDELEAQQAELERALAELAEEKERMEGFYRFGEAVAGERTLEELAALVLRELGDFTSSEFGALYALADDTGSPPVLVATRGLDPESLPSELGPGAGLAGRAYAERRSLFASHGESGLRLTALGVELALKNEAHIPLMHGERAVGVVSLAGLGERSLSGQEREAIEHLADQAAIALASALALREGLRLLDINSAVLNASEDGICLIDPDGRTVLANPALRRLVDALGVDPAATHAEQSAALEHCVTDPERLAAATARIAADPECVTEDEFELTDARRSFRRYTAPVRDADGGLIGRVVSVRETTAERHSERLKSELVATVSHELRTPLASVLGYAELMLTRELDATTRTRSLETIYAEARRLTELVNDFLDLQRIEEGRLTLAREPFELAPLLRDTVDLYSAQSGAHHLELALPAEPLVVSGDRDRIAQVAGNLVSNAIKYSPDGGPITIRAEITDAGARVSVQDTGLGIPAGEQAYIFQRFFRVRTPERRSIGGSGLGLALCREIVEAHGGSIGFESSESQGSTFWFELPRQPQKVTGARVPAAGERTGSAPRGQAA